MPWPWHALAAMALPWHNMPWLWHALAAHALAVACLGSHGIALAAHSLALAAHGLAVTSLGSHGSTCLGLGSPCLGSHGVALASHALAWPAHALSLPRQALPPKNNPKSRKEATWHGVGSPCLLLACCQLPTVCTPRAQNVHFGPPAKLAHAIFDFSVPKFILTPLEGFPSNQTPMPQEFYFLRFSQFFGFKK
jgi:hypothetical protein